MDSANQTAINSRLNEICRETMSDSMSVDKRAMQIGAMWYGIFQWIIAVRCTCTAEVRASWYVREYTATLVVATTYTLTIAFVVLQMVRCFTCRGYDPVYFPSRSQVPDLGCTRQCTHTRISRVVGIVRLTSKSNINETSEIRRGITDFFVHSLICAYQSALSST